MRLLLDTHIWIWALHSPRNWVEEFDAALVFDLTLVTTDSQLLACSWLKTLPND